MIEIPDTLRTAVFNYWGEESKPWLEGLEAQIANACVSLQLNNLVTLPNASTAYVAKVELADGTPAVLKITYPAIIGESVALAAYDYAFVIKVLAVHDGALLLEWCSPGTSLAELADTTEVVRVTTTLMTLLWNTERPTSLPSLATHCDDLARQGISTLRQRRDLNGVLFGEGLELLGSLAQTATSTVLLHGDLHPGNILAGTRAPWIVIDPRPLLGDPAYEPIQLIVELPLREGTTLSLAELIRRITSIARLLNISSMRVAQWGLARRTDWALFCHRTGATAAAERAQHEAELFAGACVALRFDQ